MEFKKWNNIIGWLVFMIAAYTYLATIEPTTSLWDCGEYIITSNKLEVGHPPGAPLFMMVGRMFSSFAGPQNAAMMVNAMSGLCSAFCILFLFWSITMLVRKLTPNYDKLSKADLIAVLGSGAIGALAYTFTDSFWFSAVEGEVYAMSSFFTAIVFWAILKWETVAHEEHSDRWIVLIFFLIGLSIGVHLLNLLALPAICFVYYFKKYDYQMKSFLLTGILSIVILGGIQEFLIPKTIDVAAWFERTFVNDIGTGFNVGTFVFIFLLAALVVGGIIYTKKMNKPFANTMVICFAAVFLGFSSFAMIVIRSNANTPLDENNPETMASLSDYLKRKQYGSWPLLHGQYWNTPVVDYADEDPTYMKAFVIQKNGRDLRRDKKELAFATEFEAKKYVAENAGTTIASRYIISDDGKDKVPVFDEKFMTYFPRMYRQGSGANYMQWSGYSGNKRKPIPTPQYANQGIKNKKQLKSALLQDKRYKEAEQLEQEGIYMPTMGENISYFANYQLGWMYWRYFMWNFSGRQSDIQGTGLGEGTYLEGNWLTGVDMLDKHRLGSQEELPSFIINNKGYNKYFLLPLILGLLGMIYHIIKSPKDWFIIFLLFVFTGLAITVYLNQKPTEPRERDYAYAASFYAFAIWIGVGIYGLFDMAKNLKWDKFGAAFGVGIGFSGICMMVNPSFGYTLLYMSVIAFGILALMMALRKTGDLVLATLAILIGLPVPSILAYENWDDHDRSERYTARDVAKAYLDSCEPNSILFTHGDNDTFPLWYVQEVEEYRTDVRVVNLSLLGTDWHVNQATRKAYDSEPVPFTAKEYQYRQGTRDVVYYNGPDNVKDTPRVHAKEAFDFALSSKGHVPFRGGKAQYTFNHRKVYIDVNVENAIAANIADTNMVKLPVQKRLEWTIKPTMIKSDFLVLDLLAHYDWKRPIYFAGEAAAHGELRKYFQSSGLTYKLTPFNISGARTPDNKMYTFHEEDMYNNLMSKFEWGGLDNDKVYVDYYTLRMVSHLRMAFWKFSSELIQNGKMERAIEILDRCFEVMPIDLVEPDDVTYPIDITYRLAGNYYMAGAVEKGDAISLELAKLKLRDLNYFVDLKPEWQRRNILAIGKTFEKLETLRAFSVEAYETKNPGSETNELGVLEGLGYDVLLTNFIKDVPKIMKSAKGKNAKAALKAQMTDPQSFPGEIIIQMFPNEFQIGNQGR